MREDTFPPVIFALLIANALIFIGEQFLQVRLDQFALFSLGPYFEFWQPISYAFLHADATHLGLNMFALWMFGRTMELVWGSKKFAIYYLVCILGAAAVQLALAQITGEPSITVGASGGVFGVLLAFGMTFPNQRILLLFPPIPMKAKYFVIFYGALELYFGVTRTMSGVAHFAHLGGMAFGLLLILYWRRQKGGRRHL